MHFPSLLAPKGGGGHGPLQVGPSRCGVGMLARAMRGSLAPSALARSLVSTFPVRRACATAAQQSIPRYYGGGTGLTSVNGRDERSNERTGLTSVNEGDERSNETCLPTFVQRPSCFPAPKFVFSCKITKMRNATFLAPLLCLRGGRYGRQSVRIFEKIREMWVGGAHRGVTPSAR